MNKKVLTFNEFVNESLYSAEYGMEMNEAFISNMKNIAQILKMAMDKGKVFTDAINKIKNKAKGFLNIIVESIKAKDWEGLKYLLNCFMFSFVPLLGAQKLAAAVDDFQEGVEKTVKENIHLTFSFPLNEDATNLSKFQEDEIAQALTYYPKLEDKFPGYGANWEKCFGEVLKKSEEGFNYREFTSKIKMTKANACKDAPTECEPCTYIGAATNSLLSQQSAQMQKFLKIGTAVAALAIAVLTIITGSAIPVVIGGLVTAGLFVVTQGAQGSKQGGASMAGN